MLDKETIKNFCWFLPPLISHRIQEKILSNIEIRNMNFQFLSKSVTGGFLSGNSKDFLAGQFYFHGYFEWRNIVLIKNILKLKEGDIIEVGANIGTETISYANLNKNKVHAFEPDESNYASLKNIKKLNNIDNLNIYNLLVSDINGFEYFQLPSPTNSGVGFITNVEWDNSILLESVSLDNKLDISSCAAIVVDVEGYEYNVLKGASKIIEKFRPFLIFEVNPDLIENRTNYSLRDIHIFMDEIGYECFLINKFSLTKIDFENFEKSSHVNWIGFPKEIAGHSKKLSIKILLNGINPFLNLKII